ncbi:MAG: holo-ACP synthase [Lachnospiraceae bacterium]|nr:holo-ACP synthase [Lachnospiraceae bacterium]
MIIGIGTDLIETTRIKKAIGSKAFLIRCFTLKEIELIKGRESSAAGCFAAKEAVAKVFGTGFSGFRPNEIEVLRDKAGKPYVNLYGDAAKIAASLGISRIHISITDTKNHAAAFAVGEGDTDESIT